MLDIQPKIGYIGNDSARVDGFFSLGASAPKYATIAYSIGRKAPGASFRPSTLAGMMRLATHRAFCVYGKKIRSACDCPGKLPQTERPVTRHHRALFVL